MFVSLSRASGVKVFSIDAEITFGGNVRQKENLEELLFCCFSLARTVAFD